MGTFLVKLKLVLKKLFTVGPLFYRFQKGKINASSLTTFLKLCSFGYQTSPLTYASEMEKCTIRNSP